MEKKKYTFKEKLRRERNAVEYSLWRFRKNMTWGKALYLLSPVWVLAIIFAVWLIPAAKGDCGEMVQYRIVGTTMYVEGFGKMDNYYYSEHHNSLAAPYRPWRPFIRRVVIRDGVSAIGVSAFYKFTNLREVEIPESVNVVQSYAFQDCRRLREVTAEGADFVGPDAFRGCTKLQTVTLKNGDGSWGGIYDGAFRDCVSLEYAVVNDETFFADECFAGCENLETIQVVRPLKIGTHAFINCRSLTAFPLENTAEKQSDEEGYLGYPDLGEGAFLNCTSLETIELPPSTREIPDSFFKGCTSLSAVQMPETVTVIGENVFSGCESLAEISLSSRLRVIGRGAFNGCVSLPQLTIPESVTEIYPSAFSGWTAEQTVYVYRDDLFAEEAFDSGAVIQVLE